MVNITMNLRRRIENDARRQRGLPVAEVGSTQSDQVRTGYEGIAQPVINVSKRNSGAPRSGYAQQALREHEAGVTYRTPNIW